MSHTKEERQILLKTAIESIRHKLKHHEPLPLQLAHYPENLQQVGASFVTLEIQKQLRGCIGTLEAYRPLVVDVATHAVNAAFQDPRFAPLTEIEFAQIDLHISVLNTPEPIQFHSEADLMRQLRPHIDGLILKVGAYRATFLPAVWESLPDKKEFLKHLKMKAGLPADYWSASIEIERYTVEMIKD
ncbi:MAG TPA: hypothetical protein DIC51_01530 [Coxiellaceae bacterium]|nr:hypothetical protein [Coxiellaceae bacterium]